MPITGENSVRFEADRSRSKHEMLMFRTSALVCSFDQIWRSLSAQVWVITCRFLVDCRLSD